MATLYHHPLCPHSRFVRLLLGEFGVDAELIEERVFERRYDFLLLDPAGRTPVMVEESGQVLPGTGIIAEYFDETRSRTTTNQRLLPPDPAARVEVRRLMSWFHDKFFAEVSEPLITEKVYKRFMPQERGGGPLDMDVVRAARNNVRYHLRYIGFLVGKRKWLAGNEMSYADLAAAAHLSSVDYLGDVPWGEDEAAKDWYVRLKSRPSFRPLLADRTPGMAPSEIYAELDF
ncbi:glutathione S-transferase family protein [Methylovirgula sp. 4M-Z18]|uniref:glutathione S-transferase family protein n=1 Tax=Methylovirgula sp. 4M-Z18 TaxID=2293567 RepID=UPI000E2E9A30|nr:glutathione S-transferase family protein [Methylovirgula sp. 4M-Z18]RFB75572.1 glutathione S-transferase family protein [Methylovirgula sp. 4M-Z18]